METMGTPYFGGRSAGRESPTSTTGTATNTSRRRFLATAGVALPPHPERVAELTALLEKIKKTPRSRPSERSNNKENTMSKRILKMMAAALCAAGMSLSAMAAEQAGM